MRKEREGGGPLVFVRWVGVERERRRRRDEGWTRGDAARETNEKRRNPFSFSRYCFLPGTLSLPELVNILSRPFVHVSQREQRSSSISASEKKREGIIIDAASSPLCFFFLSLVVRPFADSAGTSERGSTYA